MEISVILFGIARDIVGGKHLKLSVNETCQVDELKKIMVNKFPEFEDLKHISVAINSEYAKGETVLRPGDEIAIIPPVSGG